MLVARLHVDAVKAGHVDQVVHERPVAQFSVDVSKKAWKKSVDHSLMEPYSTGASFIFPTGLEFDSGNLKIHFIFMRF